MTTDPDAPAYPIIVNHIDEMGTSEIEFETLGMTKREVMATQIMGHLMGSELIIRSVDLDDSRHEIFEATAAGAIGATDALIEALNAKKAD